MVRILVLGFLIATLAACGDNVVKSASTGAQAGSLSIKGDPPKTVPVGTPFSFTPDMGTAERAELQFFATKPDWLSLDPDSGELTGTPAEKDVGVHEVELAAIHSDGGSASIKFQVEVGVPVTELPQKADREVPTRAAAAVLEGKLYVLGGEISGSSTNQVLVFNPTATGEEEPWTVGPHLLQPRSNFAAVSYKGKIYIFGGVDQNGSELATGEVFDPASGWALLKNPSFTARRGLCAAVLGERIYLVGGNTLTLGVLKDVNIFEPSAADGTTGVWSAVQDGLVAARTEHGCVALGERLVVFGGRGSNAMEVFEGDRFVNSGTSPVPVTSLWTGAEGDKIYLFGGEMDSGTINSVYRYNYATAKWSRMESSLKPRTYFSGAKLGDAFYFFGGGSNKVEMYRPVFDYPAQ